MLYIQEQVPLKELTTFKVGGNARYFCEVHALDELEEALAFAKEKKLPVFVLGGGSNIVVSDQGFPGLVIRMLIKGIEVNERDNGEVEVIAGAGEVWDDLVKFAVQHGLYGIENLSLIPGTVGAAPVQNIGAYGSEVKDTLSWLDVYDPRTGDMNTLSNKECGFGYRWSIFKEPEYKHLVITRVAFRLKKNGTINVEYKDLKEYAQRRGKDSLSLGETRQAVIEIRTGKFPDLSTTGTAGSFFKNPIISKEMYGELALRYPGLPSFPAGEHEVKVPLGWILDNVCNIKGMQKGNVGVYEKQALVLINVGKATAEEIRLFAQEIVSLVTLKTGIDIVPEVEFVGTF